MRTTFLQDFEYAHGRSAFGWGVPWLVLMLAAVACSSPGAPSGGSPVAVVRAPLDPTWFVTAEIEVPSYLPAKSRRAILHGSSLAVCSGEASDNIAVPLCVSYEEQAAGQWVGEPTIWAESRYDRASSAAFTGSLIAVGTGRLEYHTQGSGYLYLKRKTGSGWSVTEEVGPSGTRHFASWVGAHGTRVVASGFEVDSGWFLRVLACHDEPCESEALLEGEPGSDVNPPFSLAVEEDVIVAGAGTAAGDPAVFLFERASSDWILRSLPFGPVAPSDQIGTSVAVAGDTVLVGDPGDDDAGEDAGAVFVFERSGGSWRKTTKLLGASAHRGFGSVVAVHGDLAAVAEDVSGNVSAPVVHVFDREAGAWSGAGVLAVDGLPAYLAFGADVSVSDGRVLVGASTTDAAGGRLFVFEQGHVAGGGNLARSMGPARRDTASTAFAVIRRAPGCVKAARRGSRVSGRTASVVRLRRMGTRMTSVLRTRGFPTRVGRMGLAMGRDSVVDMPRRVPRVAPLPAGRRVWRESCATERERAWRGDCWLAPPIVVRVRHVRTSVRATTTVRRRRDVPPWGPAVGKRSVSVTWQLARTASRGTVGPIAACLADAVLRSARR